VGEPAARESEAPSAARVLIQELPVARKWRYQAARRREKRRAADLRRGLGMGGSWVWVMKIMTRGAGKGSEIF
jgi:hypothetical protein